ncbi:cupin domain-containing protein [uncultured Thiodictyon sp.]|uniref:cupin domain-containing protein n=1 Tax=uncultured Thiodictyon sp. TaxID=1846217 RepID=UPI0025FEFDF1|nr:cupin domain-containing protein [uncultured Thiodictyon sp.]
MKMQSAMVALALVFGVRGAAALDASATVQVTPLLKTTTTWNGAPLAYPSGPAEVTALLVEIAPGGETGWHRHPVPSFAFVLQGTLEVTTQEGLVHHLVAGQALAEVVNTVHNGRNVGTVPVKLAVFYAGIRGQAVSEKMPVPTPNPSD